MQTHCDRCCAFLLSEDGPSATEYAVLLALILLTAISMITVFGEITGEVMSTNQSSIDQAING